MFKFLLNFIDELAKDQLAAYKDSYAGRLYSFDPSKQIEVSEPEDILKIDKAPTYAQEELKMFQKKIKRLKIVKEFLKRFSKNE